jgi:opacity protein-like surface antigen
MRKIVLIGLLAIGQLAFAQTKKKTYQYVDVAATVGTHVSIAGSYGYNWKLGKKQHWEIGIGARVTNTFGSNVEFTTAPAKLARTNTIPFAIVFAGQNTVNWDTLTVKKTFTSGLNFTTNFGYNFNEKWGVGFNIDVIGLTLGSKSSAVLLTNGVAKNETTAKPQAFNALLTGDLDYGTLNSEFYVKYAINDTWTIRGVYQYLFNEYKTTTIKQVAPDGTLVDRFRSKANNIGVGVTYRF